jgi:hypothetical protein
MDPAGQLAVEVPLAPAAILTTAPEYICTFVNPTWSVGLASGSLMPCPDTPTSAVGWIAERRPTGEVGCG